jgi:hypothetical protein
MFDNGGNGCYDLWMRFSDDANCLKLRTEEDHTDVCVPRYLHNAVCDDEILDSAKPGKLLEGQFARTMYFDSLVKTISHFALIDSTETREMLKEFSMIILGNTSTDNKSNSKG